MKRVKARTPGVCAICSRQIRVGTPILRHFETRLWGHLQCVVTLGATVAKQDKVWRSSNPS